MLLSFRLSEDVPAGERVDVHAGFFPSAVTLKGNFLRLSGAIEFPEGAKVPSSATVKVVSEDAESGDVYDRLSLKVPIKSDGTFDVSKMLKKNIRPRTLQAIYIQTDTDGLPKGTEVSFCLDVIKSRKDLTNANCAVAVASAPDDDEPPGTANSAPVASVTASPTSVPAGDGNRTVVTIDASGSSDPDGDVLSFSWTVPSGTFVNGIGPTDEVIEVTFPGAAPYNVTVVVSDNRGANDGANITIGIN